MRYSPINQKMQFHICNNILTVDELINFIYQNKIIYQNNNIQKIMASLLEKQSYRKKISFVKSDNNAHTLAFTINVQCNHDIDKSVLMICF